MNAPTAQTALPIHIQSLTKKYGSLFALNSVNLDIKSGEFLTLLGPSGSGKTTLLMAIAGFNRPDSGSIKFGDEEVILKPPHKREVGMVFQSYALFPHMSVAENVGFPLKLRRVKRDEIKARVEHALATVQLDGLGDRGIGQLSGGQRQRVALARAFVFKPRILLMDEPLSALDKKLREQMQIELKNLHEQLGVTTVYVTHDQREALTMSDRIVVINHGELCQIDTPHAIYNQPANAFVADFLGESTMLPLSKNRAGDLFYQDQFICSPDHAADTQSNSTELLVIRPERLFLTDNTQTNVDTTVVFHGTVTEFVFQGDTAFVVMAINDQHSLSFRFATDASSTDSYLHVGQMISVGLEHKNIIVIPKDETT